MRGETQPTTTIMMQTSKKQHASTNDSPPKKIPSWKKKKKKDKNIPDPSPLPLFPNLILFRSRQATERLYSHPSRPTLCYLISLKTVRADQAFLSVQSPLPASSSAETENNTSPTPRLSRSKRPAEAKAVIMTEASCSALEKVQPCIMSQDRCCCWLALSRSSASVFCCLALRSKDKNAHTEKEREKMPATSPCLQWRKP